MKRDEIFKNVSFGGGWSERIVGVEQRIKALEVLRAAIDETAESDLRLDTNMIEALQLCTGCIPRAKMLHVAWMKILSYPNSALRQRELQRLYELIEKGLGTSVEL